MAEVNESDRFECVIVNVFDKGMWKGVVVEEVRSGGRVYFGRTKAEGFNYEPGDSLFIGIRPLAYPMEERTMEVILYDGDDNKLDWTYL
ncbi:hypothetical protein [Methanolobus chelungpuianus]|uniref:Uncharacterized protein n=1 Tax=Methanolobus chelungpuianus TaxID=502115 RepID=A0AAE3HAK3_9EURY|nr:hypothetical protein [Methanolobus chelungpuianus]MCQ6963056.1 hypothetical protein [Methanolobus chelungpuianus]